MSEENLDSYRYLIISFSIKGEDSVFSYVNHEHLSLLGLDPNKPMDIKLDFKKDLHIVSLDLTNESSFKYKSEFLRDLNLRKLLGDI